MKDNSLVFSVGEKDFEKAVIERSQETPVVVDFWAPWCGPCRMLAPVLEELVAKRNGEVLLAKVNTDEEQALAVKYRVNVLPTVIAFKKGKPVLDFEGLLPESNLAHFLDSLCPTAADRTVQDAAALEKADPVKAEKLYREALRQDRNQDAARLGLARLLIAQDKDGEAAEVLEPVGPGGEHGPELERLTSLLWLKNQARHSGDEHTLRSRHEVDPNNPQTSYDLATVLAAKGENKAALDLLLAAGQRDRKLAKEKVREAMVKIFNVVGPRSDIADEYRDKLSALLY
jgi:putative thioredoxin